MTPDVGPAELRELMGTSYTVSEPQWAAISTGLDPAVVIAGAGSGKTELMAARVVYLVATGAVRPDQVLGLTFTTKAAAELRARVRGFLATAGLDTVDGELVEPRIATYNAYAASLLSEHGLRIGHEPDTRVMADASRFQVAARAVARHAGTVDALSDSPPHVITWLLALDGQISEHLQTTDAVRAHDDALRPVVQAALDTGPKGDLPKVLAALTARRELLALVDDYRALKTDLGLMDFSDQIALAARLVAEHPDVGAGERDRFRAVLLDEYQDTSVAQAELLAGLFGGGHPVTAVGDPNQAIYGWRGASVSNILGFDRQFPTAAGAPATTYPLVVNRRSDVRILQTANLLAQPLLDEFPQVAPLSAKDDAGPGEVRAAVHETYAAELAWLVDEVHADHAAGTPWRKIGVLTRDNAHAADVFDALSAAEVPVEIVGLNGLLRLPEVAEVVATLTVVGDVTANAELLHLLAGPRWMVGPRDLALLARRAREVAGRPEVPRDLGLGDELRLAAAGADAAEVVALSDALDQPGEPDRYPYSPEGRARLEALARELRYLREHAGEPLLDLVRRIIDVTGIDLELASSVSEAAQARRDNLDRFVEAVAEFQAVDGGVSLPALLSYLTAEDELGTGLDVATPTLADSVKLLTVHRAKGLEFGTVFLPGMCATRFPHETLRSQWPRGQAVLPTPLRGDASDLPAWTTITSKGLTAFHTEARAHQEQEERRLGYVALTRAEHRLVVSSYLWTESRKKPLAPSPYLVTVRDAMAGWGATPDTWLELPPDDTPNPAVADRAPVSWPVTERTAESLRRITAAELVAEADAELAAGPALELDLGDAAGEVATWEDEIERLLAEARRERADVLPVVLPSSLSATAIARLRDDPDAFARELARPMPRPPSPAARFGTRFHAWVETRFGQQALLDTDELADRGDADVADHAELAELVELFEQGEFADRAPFAVEAPFALVLAGQVVRGRVDAVYEDGDGFLVVDWKTNRQQDADPLQLSLYRLAWAELRGVPVERVRAGFYYVRDQQLVEPPLLDRVELESIVVPRLDR